MKKRFLFRRITRQRGDVVCGDAKFSGFVETNFANAALAFLDEATMAAGVTLERAIGQLFDQFRRSFSGQRIQNFGERS
jgi:hypothetical protein